MVVRESDRFVGRSQLGCGVALTVEAGRWARGRICGAARGSGAVASRTPRRPPSRKSRSRPRSARNICAETGSSGSHSIIHRHLERIYIIAIDATGWLKISFKFVLSSPSISIKSQMFKDIVMKAQSDRRGNTSCERYDMQDSMAQEERPRRKGTDDRSEVNRQARKTLFTVALKFTYTHI